LAGFIKLYLIGGRGGFDGADGINPIDLIIGVGASDREWLEPIFAAKKSYLGIEVIIPDPDNYQNSIIDACIAFAPDLFKKCELLHKVAVELGGSNRLDFTDKNTIPKSWEELRDQARPIFGNISVFESPIIEISGKMKFPKWC